ncbi:MAG: DUF5698 domain-containing protein [Desulfobacterales bacterium]|jgi:uncharacterized protein YebE (UPF0316 family)|nr:DUF5698 domain-containing protein [Desulfobacterales bacterium]
MLDAGTLLTGILIFLARICDVSLGTVRTIVTVQGRGVVAFFLAIFEILIWITVISTVVQKVASQPILALFYALGFATGNLVGIAVERKIALGFMILRVFTRTAGRALTERLRNLGQPVTVFQGEGMRGPVDELYIACRRRDLRRILSIVNEEDPESFYITEMARDVCRTIRPLSAECSGWRSVFKRK